MHIEHSSLSPTYSCRGGVLGTRTSTAAAAAAARADASAATSAAKAAMASAGECNGNILCARAAACGAVGYQLVRLV